MEKIKAILTAGDGCVACLNVNNEPIQGLSGIHSVEVVAAFARQLGYDPEGADFRTQFTAGKVVADGAGFKVDINAAARVSNYHAEDMPQRMEDMTEPQLSFHLSNQLRFIKGCQTPDTVGSMLIVFQEDGIVQYGATIDPETVPAALRELATRIERRESVKRADPERN